MKVFLDTGILISVLNKEPIYQSSLQLLEKIQDRKIEGFVSVVTFAEIFSIYYRIDETKTNLARSFIQSIIVEDHIVPIVRSIAEFAGKIRAEHKVSLGDSLIIASSILVGCDYLISLDNEIKNVKLLKVKEPAEIV